MPHTDIRSRLRPEEIERLEEIQRKYPEIDFAVQRCTQYRASNIRRYMELSRWDPEVQRLLALSGYRWKDVHLVIAAISRSRGDYKRRRLKELNEWVPPCLTDELKPLAERVDSDGDPESLAAELAKAQNAREIAEIKLEAANSRADSEKSRADKAEKRADEAFEFIQQMQEQMSQSNEQWRESVGQFLAAHPAAAAPQQAAGQGADEAPEDDDLQETKGDGGHPLMEQLFDGLRADQFRPWVKDPQVREWYAGVLEKAADSNEAVFVHTDKPLDLKGCLLDDIDLPEFARAVSAACVKGKGCSPRTLGDKLHDLYLQRKNRK